MKKLLFLLGIFIAANCSLFAQTPKVESDFPVTFSRLVSVLKNNQLKESQIVEVINTNGVNFNLSHENESRLRELKAGSKILAAINQQFVSPASVGILNGKAINLVIPKYPAAAQALNASGSVNVFVSVDREGNVVAARAVSGHSLLKLAAEEAALASKFTPFTNKGQKIRVLGIVVYNFAK